MLPAVIATGVDSCTSCQPDAVSLVKVAEASKVPVFDQRLPTCVPVLAAHLVEADRLDPAAAICLKSHPEFKRRDIGLTEYHRRHIGREKRRAGRIIDYVDRDAWARRLESPTVIDRATLDCHQTRSVRHPGRTPIARPSRRVPGRSIVERKFNPSGRPPPASVAVPMIVTGAPVETTPPTGSVITEVGGVKSVDCVAATNPDCSVAGCTPMSAKRLTVACFTRVSTGVPGRS